MRITGTGNLEITGRGEDNTNPTSFYSASAINQESFFGSGLDDISITGTYSGGLTKEYVVKISVVGVTDSFQWSNDGGQTFSANVLITGGAQLLELGISVTFTATTGHTLNDYWSFVALNNPIALASAPGKETLIKINFQNEKCKFKFRLSSGTKFAINKVEFFGTPIFSMRPD